MQERAASVVRVGVPHPFKRQGNHRQHSKASMGQRRKQTEGGEMNDETIELIKRHREAAHQQGVIVGIGCTAGAFLIVAVLVKLMGVTCG